MSELLAVIDANPGDAPQGLATVVAGLTLLERVLRLAAVCGAQRAVLVSQEPLPSLGDLFRADPPLDIQTVTDIGDVPRNTSRIWLKASVVYERSAVRDAASAAADLPRGESRRQSSGHLAITGPAPSAPASLDEVFQAGPATLTPGWTIEIDSPDAVRRATRRLWNGCRKKEDGLVARYLNRHLSLAISRAIVQLPIGPNHVSALTFALGGAAALAAAFGGYAGFLVAGLLYQINSVIDGVDGELARVRYEFSVLGEWLDTISDDLSDFLLYLGLGFGAFRTLPDAPGPFGPELWLALGVAAALGKAASMVVYYRWLRARGRGDLLAFQWEFKDPDDEPSHLSRALSLAHYAFRKDFIVFVAMVMAIAGALPYLLFALAPGNLIVAVSVLVQQARQGGPQA